MKRIVFFISSMEDGGAQRVISLISNKLVERDFEIKILKYFKGENAFDTNENIKIDCVEENTKTTKVLSNIKWIKDYFKNNADIVISFLVPFNIIALLANKNNNIPIIVADRNDPNKVPSNPLIKIVRNILYKKADKVIVQTNKNKQYFDNLLNINSEVIYNPLDSSNKGLAINTKKDDLIVSVGRLEKQKNQMMLIEAFYEIHKKYKTYKLIIYGEGSYRKELESRINELGLNNDVIMPGRVKDVQNKIASAKLFVLSSNYEGMPNALAEAMLIGLPCISTRVSGAEDIINKDSGVLIDINNKDQLISSIDNLLSNKELLDKYSNNAVKIDEKYNINTITDLWEEKINNILK